MILRLLASVVMLFVASTIVSGTDRYYGDISESSPSKKYKVEAKSPHNQKGNFRPFQSNFVYQCFDTETGKLMWTRAQLMSKPVRLSKDSTEEYSFASEPSPVDIIVSDSGWTAIRTDGDEVVFVNSKGVDQSKYGVYADGLNSEEKEKYVHFTTAGSRWSGYSEWYFLQVHEHLVFVVRPWWGRRIFIDPETGKPSDVPDINETAIQHEREFVLSTLKRGELHKAQADWSLLHAAYFAGQMQISEAIPLLHNIEGSKYCGSSTLGGLGGSEVFQNEVNPHNYRTFTMRQVVHLSLRRLGEIPEPYAVHEFELSQGDESLPFLLPMLTQPRHEVVPQLKVGMGAKEVLLLAGSPDFMGYDTWSYDVDSSKPYSLTLTWDERKVTDINRTSPPLWKSGISRDDEIAN